MLSASYLEEFDARFQALLHQQGSSLIQGVVQEPVTGDVKYIQQNYVGEARFIDDNVDDIAEYKPIKYGRRKLQPRAFICPIMLDQVDITKQGMPDIEQLAQQASDSCGKMIDQIIIKGISGTASTDQGDVALPDSQILKYDEATLGAGDEPDSIKFGLSTAKIGMAVQMLRAEFNSGPIICVANNYAFETLRADKRAAIYGFGTSQKFSNRVNIQFIDEFIPSEQVETFTQNVDGSNYNASYAYVYAMNMIRLGCSMPLTMKIDKNDVLQYMGMYDCVRMQEEAVVKIEVLGRKI